MQANGGEPVVQESVVTLEKDLRGWHTEQPMVREGILYLSRKMRSACGVGEVGERTK